MACDVVPSEAQSKTGTWDPRWAFAKRKIKSYLSCLILSYLILSYLIFLPSPTEAGQPEYCRGSAFIITPGLLNRFIQVELVCGSGSAWIQIYLAVLDTETEWKSTKIKKILPFK